MGFNISGMPVVSCQHTSSRRRTGRSLTRSTLRPEVPQNDDGLFAFLDRSTLDRAHKIVFGIERARLTSESKAFLARDFCDSPAWCEIAAEDPIIDHFYKGPSNALKERTDRK